MILEKESYGILSKSGNSSSKSELFDIFDEARKLMFSIVSANSNLVLGFAWKTDSTVPQDHPAYYMWHQLSDHRYEVELSPFTHADANKSVKLFEKELKGIKEIVICGILTNLCVRSLAQEAYDRDFQITIIKDCCVAFDAETHEFTLKDLKATREEIEFLNLNEFTK